MAGDYTRFTFKPQRDYSGVFKQQGRVDLDADFNELIEIIDRRWRSETIDIIGHCIVPNTTPDAFLVIPTAIGAFDIGIGRMYVDGIQVENHGLPPLAYLADVGELNGTSATPYSDQPYLPKPLPPALAAAPNTTDLVYIDVWEREVTVLEDPSIREIALGGPDTTTRMQSAWQVRVLENVGQHGCGDDIPAWNQLIAPSAGRLTTSAVAPLASDDPCIISPTGGYRGLENRLYRVEIHSTGPIGGAAPAKFKWSRNNATIASSVSSIPAPDQVIVQQVGRDQVLRFDIGNWIEIIDDFREFQSLTGHMAQITAIDEANRLLTFAPPIPGTINFDAANPTRHTRMRRWDQSQSVDVNGLLDVTAGPIDIEDGIRVTFGLNPAGGNFRVGDYWVFAARTADGSVEILQDAPPRGILHHYCRLGFIHWGIDIKRTTFTDCRVHWPAEVSAEGCACTVCVSPDAHHQGTPSLQMAVDKVIGAGGGTICLEVGAYVLKEPLRIRNARSLSIVGKGVASELFAEQAAVEVHDSTDVALESFSVVCRGSKSGSGFLLHSSAGVRVEHLQIENGNIAGAAVGLSGALSNVVIRDNVFKAPLGLIDIIDPKTGATGLVDLCVENNQFACQVAAIRLTNLTVHQQMTRIAQNRVSGCEDIGFELTGTTVPGFGVDVISNELTVLGDGIVAGVDGLRIIDNDLFPLEDAAKRGIVLTKGSTGDRLDECQIVGNRIGGQILEKGNARFAHAIAATAELGSIAIARNQIADAKIGLLVEGAVESLSIDGNQIIRSERAMAVTSTHGRITACSNQLETLHVETGVIIDCPDGDCVFSDNHSRQLKAASDGVVLNARTLIVSSNRMLGGVRISLQSAKGPCTVVGNITGGEIRVSGNPLPLPWGPLNIQNV
jgi:Family of unknown function (DUF6519)